MGAIARSLEIVTELWIPAVVLLVVLTLALGVKRIWTVLGLVLAALFVIAVVRRLATAPDTGPEDAPSSFTPASAIEILPNDQATVSDLKITGSTAPWAFSGVVTNRNADHTLLSATIRVIRRDCYEGALDPSGCVILWQTNKRVNLATTPGSEERFVEEMSPRAGVARAQGTIKDEFALIGLTGRPVSPTP